MIKNICIVEDQEDFEILFNSSKNDNCLYIPLDIKTFILCKEKKVNIFEFNENLTNNFHKLALDETDRFIQGIIFKKKLPYSLKSEILGFLRFRFHSIIFLIEVIEKSIDKYEIEKIFVSGIHKKNHYLHDAKICSEIISDLYPNLVKNLSKRTQDEVKQKIYKYNSSIQILNKTKKIILSNGGYNFKRIKNKFRKLGFEIWLPYFNDLSLCKRFLYFIKGYKLINFQLDKSSLFKEEVFIEKITFNYQNKYNLSNLLNKFYNKLNYHFNDQQQKIIAVKKFVNQNNFALLISNIARGLDGAILDNDLSQTSLCIPHGIISKSLNEHDIKYKKIIAEAVFNGESDYFAIQSKIMLESLETHKVSGKPIVTGNLIFSENTSKFKNKKEYLLYATTLKDFTNLQYLGVDMFYEFWEIMKKLNKEAKTKKTDILVKVHPQFSQIKNDLKNYFRFLKFSNKPIDILLQNAISIITLSSGTIEDALNSRVPVILFDYKKRYKQINSLKNENNSAVFYIDKLEKLNNVINIIKNQKNINFEKYVFKGTFNRNFNEKVLPLIRINDK